MGKAVPSQHPAVVLRSSYTLVRALLAIAMIAVVGLTAAVVILADDGEEVAGSTSARPIESINYGGFNPATGRPESAPLSDGPAGIEVLKRFGFSETQALNISQGQSYIGGPEEGNQSSAPARLDRDSVTSPPGVRNDGGPEEGTSGIVRSAPEVYVNPSTGYASRRHDGAPEEETPGPTPCCGPRP